MFIDATQLKPSRPKKKSRRLKTKRKIIFYSTISLLIVLLFSFCLFIAHTKSLAIKDIQIEGIKTINKEEILQKVRESINGKYYYLFPKRNTIIYPKKIIEGKISLNFPQIKEFKIKRDGLNALNISLTERVPDGIWCVNEKSYPSNTATTTSPASLKNKNLPSGACYFLDDTGFIYERAPNFTGSVYFRYYGQLATTTPHLKTNKTYPYARVYIPEEKYKITRAFAKTIKELDFEVEAIYKINEEDLSLVLKSGGNIYISQKQNLQEAFLNLETVVFSEEFKSKTHRPLNYIDLRFGKKVYFDFF